MNIELVKVKYGKQELKWLKHLFLSAFPPDERPPFFIMRRRANEYVDWWKITADNEDAGYQALIKKWGGFLISGLVKMEVLG